MPDLACVYVLAIDHKHGSNYSVHKTEEGAKGALFAFVASWWPDEMKGAPMPESEGEAIQDYFAELAGRESFTIEDCHLLD